MKTVVIYTDGACKGNPGPGGYAAILQFGEKEKIIRGGASHTTNNRMELTAVVEAVKALRCPCRVQFVTDSTYVMMTNEKWKKWQKKRNVPNMDLWQELLLTAREGKHKLSFQHVYGHTGEINNERCDKIASEQAFKFATGKKKDIPLMDAVAVLAERE